MCIEKRKKLWKERKKDLTRASIVRDGDDSQLCGNPAQAIILKSDCNAEHTHQDPASDGLPPILYSMACRRNRYGAILELPCRISVAKRACRLLFPSCRQNGMWEMIGGWTLKTRSIGYAST